MAGDRGKNFWLWGVKIGTKTILWPKKAKANRGQKGGRNLVGLGVGKGENFHRLKSKGGQRKRKFGGAS